MGEDLKKFNCSFCGENGANVWRIFYADPPIPKGMPPACICDRCIELANELIVKG